MGTFSIYERVEELAAWIVEWHVQTSVVHIFDEAQIHLLRLGHYGADIRHQRSMYRRYFRPLQYFKRTIGKGEQIDSQEVSFLFKLADFFFI